jgi:Na+/melibiose symporter-like transporter
MFLYKLRKILREKWLELLRLSSVLSFIASFIPLFPLIFIYQDDFSRSEKKQMFVISAICLFINLTIIYFTDFFGFNIIFSLILGNFFSFCLYFIPFLILMMFFEFSELQLDKDEIREAKLNSLFRKLF